MTIYTKTREQDAMQVISLLTMLNDDLDKRDITNEYHSVMTYRLIEEHKIQNNNKCWH